MSEMKIRRRLRTVDVTLTTATSSATTINFSDAAGAVISIGTVSTNASTLQIYGAMESDGAYRRVYGSDGSAADVTLTPSSTVGTVYSLPDAAFALPFLKIVSGTTNSTGTTGVVSMKS
jgi:hypothetical protein